MSNNEDINIKLAIIGTAGVGKSSIINKFINSLIPPIDVHSKIYRKASLYSEGVHPLSNQKTKDEFDSKINSTFGANYSKKKYDNK